MVKCLYMDDAFRLLLQKVTVSIIAAGFDKVDTDWKRGPEWWPYNRMFWILDGEGYVEVDGQGYYPPAGSLVILPRRSKHAFASISENTYTKYWCYFNASLGEDELFRLYPFPVFLQMKDKARVSHLFEQLHHHFQHRKRTSPFMLRASILEILSLFIDQAIHEDDAPILPQSDVLETVIQYIEQNLSRRMTVEELANLVHYHPNYFIRFFNESLGKTPVQYIKHLRMERAKALLLSTSLPVSKIAELVGIQHPNFTPMFKEQTGFTPSDFRDMAKKNGTPPNHQNA